MAKKSSETKPRALRADAERNRTHLLETAQRVFATEGLEVPIDEVARRAGLGVGTLYRHFPTKEALFAAIVIDRMTKVAERAEGLVDAEDAGEAFFAMLGAMAEESGKKKDFIQALERVEGAKASMVAAKQRFRAAVDTLLERAQRTKAVRADVSVEDVLALFRGVVAVGGDTAEARARRLAILFDGLRAAPKKK